MLGTRATRLLDQAAEALATGGTAHVIIRDVPTPHPLFAYRDEGDGLIAIDIDENMVRGSLFVYEDDLVAVIATPFQDPA